MYLSQYTDKTPHVAFSCYIEAYEKLSTWEKQTVNILQRAWVKVFNFKSEKLPSIIVNGINYALSHAKVLEKVSDTLAYYYAAFLPPDELMALYKTEDAEEIARADVLVEEWLREAQRVMDTYYQRMEKITEEQSH